jgi:hypothetical protein
VERGAIEGGRPLVLGNIVEGSWIRRGSRVISIEIAVRPHSEEAVEGWGDGETLVRTRRVVEAPEGVAIDGRPFERIEGRPAWVTK